MRRDIHFHPGQKSESERRQMPQPPQPQWNKLSPDAPNLPAPPPIWTRYIDTRFKQFVNR
jgi:hypothetical protein